MHFDELKKHIARYVSVPEAEWQKFVSLVSYMELERGDFFARESKPASDLGFVRFGLLKVYYSNSEGRQFIRSFPREGWPVSPAGAQIEGRESDVSIEAIERSGLWTINYQSFRSLMDQHMVWQELGRKGAEQFLIVREKREKIFITMDAGERYKYVRKSEPDLINRVPGYDLAAYLGISPVSLSRLRRKAVTMCPSSHL